MALVVLTDAEGHQGLGWTEDGTGAARLMIEQHLRRFVVGESPFDVERDVMYRASIPYGRAGAAMEAISALDIALWDLMGHATGKPVWAHTRPLYPPVPAGLGSTCPGGRRHGLVGAELPPVGRARTRQYALARL